MQIGDYIIQQRYKEVIIGTCLYLSYWTFTLMDTHLHVEPQAL